MLDPDLSSRSEFMFDIELTVGDRRPTGPAYRVHRIL